MDLVEVTVLAELAALVAGAFGGRRRHRWQISKMGAHEVDQRLMLQRAGGGDHHAVRAIVARHVGGQRLARHRAHALLGTEHGAAHGLRRVGGVLEMVEDDVVGRVVRLADLLQDHAALALDLLGDEGGMGEDVADDVGGEAEVFLQHLAVIGGAFARRVGVEVAADILDLARDGGRVALRGALERHVFEEVGDAVLRCRLVARAGADIGAEGDGLDARHGLAHHGEAVGQGGQADGVGHSVASVAARMGAHRGFDGCKVVRENRVALLPVI